MDFSGKSGANFRIFKVTSFPDSFPAPGALAHDCVVTSLSHGAVVRFRRLQLNIGANSYQTAQFPAYFDALTALARANGITPGIAPCKRRCLDYCMAH